MTIHSRKTCYLTLSALFAALIFLFTAYLFHIPTPFGYYLCTGFMYGSWLFSVARVFTDLLSPLLCAVLFLLIGHIMDRTNFKSKFNL